LGIEVIDPDHAHHAPEVACPGHVVEILPGRGEVLHLAHDGIEAEAAEELAHLRRVVAHDQGDNATGFELFLGGIHPEFGHDTPPIA
jgi:hypothetical protein